ncbi:Rz-like lysis system protein LysB [Caballeronia sp. HLA56]
MSVLAIKLKLAVCVLVIAALVSSVLYVRALRTALIAQSDQLRIVSQRVADRDQTIRELQRDAIEKARQRAQLDKSTTAAKNTESKQREAMRKAIHDSPTVQSWADTALPDDVMRLSANPAYASAADFSAAMPDDHTVRPSSDVSTH